MPSNTKHPQMEPGFSKGFALMTGTIFWGALYGNGEWDFFRSTVGYHQQYGDEIHILCGLCEEITWFTLQ